MCVSIFSLDNSSQRHNNWTYLINLFNHPNIYIYVPRKAWKSLNKMDNIWKGNIDENLKILLFRATTNNYFILISEMGTDSLGGESIGWHIHSDLRQVQNLSWKDRVSKKINPREPQANYRNHREAPLEIGRTYP